jgi:hypothetical protein
LFSECNVQRKCRTNVLYDFVGGLKPSDLGKLQGSVIDAIKPETIQEIDVDHLKV